MTLKNDFRAQTNHWITTILYHSTYELEQYIRLLELESPLIELKERNDPFAEEDHFHRPTKSASISNMPMDTNESHATNMRDELFELAKLLFTDAQTQKLLNYILFNLDDRGYSQFQDLDYTRFDEQQINDGFRYSRLLAQPALVLEI